MRKGTIAMRSIFLSFLLAFVASAPSRAAEQPAADPVLAEATGLAGTAMFMTSGAPGMVLVVVRGDRSLVLGYGETEKGNKQTPDGNSLLRLNSITKVFTTEVLVSLAAEGKLSLAAARSCDPFSRPAARDGRRAGRRVFARLADAGGSLEMAPRLQTPLGTRQHRRLFQCRLRSPCRRHRNSGRALLS